MVFLPMRVHWKYVKMVHGILFVVMVLEVKKHMLPVDRWD